MVYTVSWENPEPKRINTGLRMQPVQEEITQEDFKRLAEIYGRTERQGPPVRPT